MIFPCFQTTDEDITRNREHKAETVLVQANGSRMRTGEWRVLDQSASLGVWGFSVRQELEKNQWRWWIHRYLLIELIIR